MFIEKYGKALKTAKETAVQNTTNTSNISTTNTNINTTSGVVDNLVYLNTSYNQSASNVSQLQTNYNNLADRLDCNVVMERDVSLEFTLPSSGTAELVTLTQTFTKSFGTKMILSMALSYYHTSFNGGNAFNIFYDIGAGWVFWDRFKYETGLSAELQRYHLILTNVSAGNKTVKIGVSDLTGDVSRGEISSACIAVYEIS